MKHLLACLTWLAWYSPRTRWLVMRASDYGPQWWRTICLDALYPDDAVVRFKDAAP